MLFTGPDLSGRLKNAHHHSDKDAANRPKHGRAKVVIQTVSSERSLWEQMESSARAVASNLPQYFPIPENDEPWGPGFAEWTNTARASCLFPGHEPNLPSALGFPPEKFRFKVSADVATLDGRPPQERILWGKPLNEEDSRPEPDLRHGRGWLEALQDGLIGG